MLYKKSSSKTLDENLFRNPTSEYRGAPFWAWNTKLDEKELVRQIEELKKMGFGGFHAHTRIGLRTKYLSEEYMNMIRACTKKAKSEDMYCYLYDEDKCPSGYGGGYVTENPKYRMKHLLLTPVKNRVNCVENAEIVDEENGVLTGKPYFIGAFDITLNEDGTLKSYKKADENVVPVGKLWYAYVATSPCGGAFNNQTYVDSQDKESIREFIRVTYDAYKDAVGEEFGKTIPSIFTDEPIICEKIRLLFPADAEKTAIYSGELCMPWTRFFQREFSRRYGFDIVERIPELFWDLPNGMPSTARYYYHDLNCQLLCEAFIEQCGDWCKNNNIEFTGHMIYESNVFGQTAGIGEVMRMYHAFDIPGIDMLGNFVELNTAKQCQSVVHQCGKEGMMSELYGVTGWDFDFKGHKFSGDWQAALGVTLRVPHLSWVSMKGSAKRDYPASINYQSAWYKEYSYIENHFARLNTVLTRGKPIVNIAVIHPIESSWLKYGPIEQNDIINKKLTLDNSNLTKWLLTSFLDFDFICESQFETLYSESEKGLCVGEMNYKVVVVPPVLTLRKSTVEILNKFVKNGGKVIFLDSCPKWVDGKESNLPQSLYSQSEKVNFDKFDILKALSDFREISISNSFGETLSNYVYNYRQDNDCRWLFVANVIPVGERDISSDAGLDLEKRLIDENKVSPENVRICVKGEFKPVVYNTMDGTVKETSYKIINDKTVFDYNLYVEDSLLVKLIPTTVKAFTETVKPAKTVIEKIDVKSAVNYKLDEPNVMVLDMAEYSFDNKNYEPKEELLRIDKKIREKHKWPPSTGCDIQPWAFGEEKIENYVYLKFTFESETVVDASLGFEEAEELFVNGKKIKIVKDGYFTDKEIYKTKIGKLKKGTNTIIIKAPIGEITSLENYFLLGDFGVLVSGSVAKITSLPKQIYFGSILNQGFPFYGAGITYSFPIEIVDDCSVTIEATKFGGNIIVAKIDGETVGRIALAPFSIDVEKVKKGKHGVELTLYPSRVNCFGTLHNCGNETLKGTPFGWYTTGDAWAYEYQLKDVGILKSPIVTIKK